MNERTSMGMSHSLRRNVACQVYDVTQYCAEHPGGEAVLRHMGGKDATTAVRAAHKTTKPEERSAR
eukprot:4709143-Amphidinium_carterae.1